MKYPTPTTKSSARPTFTSDSPGQNDTLQVTSRVKRWYYTTFQGYRVTRETSTPEAGLFGAINYKNTWHLKKDD